MNRLKSLLQQMPWGLIVTIEWVSFLLLVAGRTDAYGIVCIVTLCGASWLNGNTAHMKDIQARLRESMQQDIDISRRAVETAQRYRQLHRRHFEMTGENYGGTESSDSSKVYQA